MLQTIINAINEREVLSLVYGNLTRVVEPHAVGISLMGNNVLWAFQLYVEQSTPNRYQYNYVTHDHVGLGYEWDWFELSQIASLHGAHKHFIGTRYGYKRGNKQMIKIFAQL